MKKLIVFAIATIALICIPLTNEARGHWETEYCPTCYGSGTVKEEHYEDEWLIEEDVPCPECNGTGYIDVYYDD